MKRLLFVLTLALWCSLSAAATPAPIRAEIDTLLARLQASGCQFNRNGSWYTGAKAKDHLIRKLEYFEKEAAIQSTEQFIELAASKSSSSGKSYQVKCGSNAPVESQVWLTVELATIRAKASKAKP